MSLQVSRCIFVLLLTLATVCYSIPIWVRSEPPVIYRRIPHTYHSEIIVIPQGGLLDTAPILNRQRRSQPSDLDYTDEFSIDPFEFPHFQRNIFRSFDRRRR